MPSEDDCKLFVAGLPESMDESALRQLFEERGGVVVNVSLPRDRATGRLRGFGFVTLASAEQAATVREALDGSLQAGRSISVRAFQAEGARRGESSPRAADRDRTGQGRTLYVGNLPYDCSEQQVVELFDSRNAGPIVRVHLPVGSDGRARGYGFVTLGSAQAAVQAIEALRGVELRGRRLQVNLAQPRGERPERPAPRSGERREPPQVRPANAQPSSPAYAPGFSEGPRALDPEAPFPGEPPRAAPGRRRAERPERSEKKKKRGRGRDERAEAGQKRGRARRWEEWDED